MDEQTVSQRSTELWRRRRAEAIEAFLDEFAPSEHADLLSQMLVTVSRLASDETSRGDLKILNATLRELRYAFKVFAPYAEIPKVSIFGSSRTPPDHPQYRQAKQFARMMQRHGWMVITGAGGGIMQAGHHGASRKASFGVAISLPFEQETNTIIADDPKLVNFKYFFTRKLIFVKEARAIVLFPGGFGTQDEGFESLTLVQTVKASPVPIVLCDEPGGTYWQHWKAFVEKELVANGMIDADDLNLFLLTDRADRAVSEVLNFYRRYHSSRFVRDELVLRLNRPLAEETLSQINDTFADILKEGRFVQVPGPLEAEEGACPDKTRLLFTFDRRSAGRLRLLINLINEAP
jgi:uncharacterized protein (TIGR00730 family)